MVETTTLAAFEYAYPVFAVAQTRDRALRGDSTRLAQAPNTVRHERQLSDHTSRWITAPNNDTLYSNIWLDLSGGPVRIRVGPQAQGRYWSLAFMDTFSNHIAVVGQRTHGTGPVDVTVLAPGQTAPADAQQLIHAPGLDVWVLCRWLVEGPHDLADCHAMQDGLHISAPPLPDAAPAPAAIDSRDPENFLRVVNHVWARNPPPERDAQALAKWAPVGLRAGDGQAWSRLPAAVQQAWRDVIGPAHDQVRAYSSKGRRLVQGWVASAPEMGNFGDNFKLRASVAMGGLAALEPVEAMYFVRFTDDGQVPLDGRHTYVLRIPASNIPTDSFWSFTMYEPAPDGRRFFADNPIGRYAIGNRTPGLQRQADGSLEIAVQHQPPASAQARANWLPCPAGPFQLALRTYLPRAELREGLAPMPALARS